ncbi:hypothetical protein GLOIN_2v1837700 [Rhizophagus clarus]|uniref:Uncharacterized protein n=1 Tax=Rhizophagus clarus TaxID=94130 RepID=A0A8H3MJC3_9GLOM|nr:hypothetical protein GLOIN_2v1837700 [Rhizophagus clarus]
MLNHFHICNNLRESQYFKLLFDKSTMTNVVIMGLIGSISYLNNNLYVIDMNNNTELRIDAGLVGGIGRIYFTDNNGNGIQVPNGFTVTTVQGRAAPFFNINGTGSYIMNWSVSYELKMNGATFGTLTTQQQQSVELDPNYNHDVI